MQDKRRTFWWE